jgi:chromosome segregation and condensation protein ScpB
MTEVWDLKARVEVVLGVIGRAVTVAALAEYLQVPENEVEDALLEYEQDLIGRDRGWQLTRRRGTVRIEVKTPYAADAKAALLGFAKVNSKPPTSAALEVLVVVNRRPGITIREISEMRGSDSTAAVESLRRRKLIRQDAPKRGQRGRRWRITAQAMEEYDFEAMERVYQSAEQVIPAAVDAKIESVPVS